MHLLHMDKNFLYFINYLFGGSVLLPLLAGLIKWKKIDSSYHPIIIAFGGLLVNETLRFVLIRNGIGERSSASYNYFALLLMWMYTWQFASWRVISYGWMWVIGATLSLLWFADYFVINGWQIDVRRYWFRIAFALELVILSIQCANGLIVSEKDNMLRNPRFLFCLAFILYYTYRIFNDAFTLRGFSNAFLKQINDLNRYLVVVQYLIFLIAVLCIPRKKNFLRLS